MADEETIRIYDAKADDYVKRFVRKEPSNSLKRFMALLPPGARVLDWGCGPATSSHHLKEAGFVPDPVDASPEMVALACENFGLQVRLGTFDDPLPGRTYHGVWANFSLLHASRDDLPKHLQQLHTALLPEGVLHLGMKRGTGENRDRFGRFYTYYETDELTDLLEKVGFGIVQRHEGEEAGLAGTVDPFVVILSKKV
ncbi:MAG: class I SAM-dependent methyltransferase [Stappiaceae bacterium]